MKPTLGRIYDLLPGDQQTALQELSVWADYQIERGSPGSVRLGMLLGQALRCEGVWVEGALYDRYPWSTKPFPCLVVRCVHPALPTDSLKGVWGAVNMEGSWSLTLLVHMLDL